MFRIRGRPWWQLAIAGALLAGLYALLLKPVLEHAVRARIESAALRHGMVAHIQKVHVGFWPLLRLEGFELDLGHGSRLRASTITGTWPGRLRLAVHAAAIAGPAGIAVSAPSTTWNVSGLFGNELRLALAQPQTGLTLRKRADPAGTTWNLEARVLDIGRLLDVRRDGMSLLAGGTAEGRANLAPFGDGLRFSVDLQMRGVRLGRWSDNATGNPQPGDPTDVTLRFDGEWQRARGSLDIPEIHASFAGAAVSGSLALRDLDQDPVIDLAFGVQKLEFGQLLGTAGLELPASLGLGPGRSHDLGSASIDLRVRGPLADPASLVVTQKIGIRAPREMPPAIARLRGDFVFRPNEGLGPRDPVDVSAASPDFIALRDVPPLFVRTLLLAEDAGFYGHRGIDLRELPAALITNWSRGAAARGASTITQQLAKNLFLSADKRLGRKLQELVITFLLESALGKERILEIYLNIIEWGPDLRGLRPAAWMYFEREPRALTPAEMAFLVSIIPGPIKYQSSFKNGSPGPGLRALVDDLLAKLRSVDAIGEEAYRRALDDPIRVGAQQ